MFTHVILRAITGDQHHRELVLEDGQSYVLGRAPDCAIQLQCPSVSRHHCLLEVHSPFLFLRDLGSLNGTLLNGKNIGLRGHSLSGGTAGGPGGDEHPVAEGDVLRIGDNLFWIDFVYPPEDEVNDDSQDPNRKVPCPTGS